MRRIPTPVHPSHNAATGFAYRDPVHQSGSVGRHFVWAMRVFAVVAILALVFAPQQAGNSAGFEAALRGLAGPGQTIRGEHDIVPIVGDTQFTATAAVPFLASYGDAASPRRAEDCLTEAIYYEGALEPHAGQRAIAQVVLNRVRHPEYPNSVCGVVFQGQHLSTSCQFTFTCDGSRARAPMPDLWRKANLVAKAALGGSVAEEVGLSTHYHADYVQPYWSHTLDQAGQIGRHVFYRWRGNAGRPEAFSSAYAGREPLIGQWRARETGELQAADVTAIASTDGLAPDVFITIPTDDAQSPIPAPFKARPLRLATGNDPVR